jgi:gas vesicle structural protein
MPVERALGGTSLVDVVDRVLDKGIVIDAWARVSLVGIELVAIEARVVVASIETYLKYSDAVRYIAPVSKPPRIGNKRYEAVGTQLALPPVRRPAGYRRAAPNRH